MKITQINDIGKLTIGELTNGNYYVMEKNKDQNNGDIKVWPIIICTLAEARNTKNYDNAAYIKIEFDE